MRTRYIWAVLGISRFYQPVRKLSTPSEARLSEVVVTESYHKPKAKKHRLRSMCLGKDFNIPLNSVNHRAYSASTNGYRSGFSKPMIRGLDIQPHAVSENGIKQEGQQCRADHGLKSMPLMWKKCKYAKARPYFCTEADAMGGVIEILPSVCSGRRPALGRGFTFRKVRKRKSCACRC